MDKQVQLRRLVEKRKSTRWPGYKCVGDYHSGVFDCDFVSPYTKSAKNLDSDIMVMLQDWSSDNVLRAANLKTLPGGGGIGHDPKRKTNQNLVLWLKNHFGVTLKDTYATNLFPFKGRRH